MGIKVFQCTYRKTNPYNFEQQVILATDADHAREVFCAKYGIRKNAKGLEIYERPFVYGKRVSKTKTELIKATEYRYYLGEYDASHYGDKTRFYCDQCKGEVSATSTFCHRCAAYLV